MSTRLRFTTAAQVFEAFPTLAGDVKVRPGDEPPLDFARKLLAQGRGFEAVAFVAYLLPRREAVWWGCQCLRGIDGNMADAALLAAEAWVREPEESQRRAAMELSKSGNTRVATTWLAMAAAQSGGSISPEGLPPVIAAPQSTARAVDIALNLAIVTRPLADLLVWTRACVESAIRFAEGGDAKLLPPAAKSASSGAR